MPPQLTQEPATLLESVKIYPHKMQATWWEKGVSLYGWWCAVAAREI
jgi:hypothetical protein